MMPSRRAWIVTATLAAVYVGLVSAGLLIHGIRSQGPLPLDDQAYLQLRQRLAAEPSDDASRDATRQLDRQLRFEYFLHRRRFERGLILLVCGAALLVVATRAATRVRLPQPQPVTHGRDRDRIARQHGRRAVAAVAGLLMIASLAAVAATPTHLSLPARSGTAMLRSEIADPVAASGLAAAVPTTNEPAADGGKLIEPPESPEPRELPGAKGPLAGTPAEDPGVGAAVAAPPLPDAATFAAAWPAFRGPSGSGSATPPPDAAAESWPTTWNLESGEGLAWKVEVPLPGVSSPIVWGERLFLTGGDEEQREVYCFQVHDGALMWRYAVPTQVDSSALTVNQDTGFAAPTMATDGVRVYAIFATGDLVALTLSGQPLWSRSLGPIENAYGHASSLATWSDRVIVQLDQGEGKHAHSKLLALDGATGNVVWETSRPVPNSWSSPLVVDRTGQPRVITCGEPWVMAYAAEDGRELWRAECLIGDIGPSPVFHADHVYAANDQAVLAAIRADGTGDVTETHLAWTADIGMPDITSPLVTDELVLLMASYGTLTCYDRQQGGEPLWEEDFNTSFTASPALAGNFIYLLDIEGHAWVVTATREGCQRVAEAELGEPVHASPAFQPGKIYIRGKQHLFCLTTTPQ